MPSPGIVRSLRTPHTIAADLLSTVSGKGADLVFGVGRVVNSISGLRTLIKSGRSHAFVTGYYANGDGGGGAYYYDSADTSSADNGGTIIVAADGGRWKLSATENISVKQFGAKAVGDDTAAVQAAANSGAKKLRFPSGTYSIDSLDLLGKYIVIEGDGIDATTIKARSATAALINANEAAEVRISPLEIAGMTIDGSGLATSCLDIRYRHLTDFKNTRFINATAQCVKAKDTWLMRMAQVEIEGAPVGLWLVGSNHRSKFDSVSFQGCTTWHIKAERNGTALDGNDALEFNNCDVEFGSGAGVYLDVTSAAFNECYLGENVDGTTLLVTNGLIQINGGVYFFGHTANSYGITANGGKTLFKGVRINGQANPGIQNLVTGTGSNAVRFEGCEGNVIATGNPVFSGDQIDYGPQGVVYTKRLGKSFTSAVNNASVSNVIAGNSQTATCTAAPGPSPIITLQAPLASNDQWKDGEPLFILIVYASNKDADLRLSGGALGGAPTASIGTLPATAGAKKTYVKLDVAASNAAYTILELLLNPVAVNDFLTIHEVILGDSRMLRAGAGSFGNLYKC